LIISSVFANVISAQVSETGLPPELEGDVEKIQNLSEKAKETTLALKDKEKWDYLAQEWKEILLKKKPIAFLNRVFTKARWVFFVLFAKHYSLSITLLGIIIIWLYLLFLYSEIIRGFSAFSSSTSWLVALAIVVITAHLQLIRKFVEFLGWLIFMKKEWYWNLIFTAIAIIALVGLHILARYLSKMSEEIKEANKKKLEEAKEKAARIKLMAAAEAGTRAFGGKK